MEQQAKKPTSPHAGPVTLCRDMRETVRARTGISTCVGIGATKTLAKLANHVAKKVPELGGVCDLTDPIQYGHWMARIPPEDIWGIGPANARKLEALGCESVADVRDLDTRAVRKAMTVVGERLVQELRGLACLDLEEVASARKGCAVTRSFSDGVEDLATMEQAVATHAAQLGEKLRGGGLATDHVTVFFHTSEHERDRPQRSVSSVVTLARGQRRHAGAGEGMPARRPEELFQGRGRHDRPRAAGGLAVDFPGARSPRPGARGRVDEGARRMQPTVRTRFGRPGQRRFRTEAGMVDQVRDEVAPLHHTRRRASRHLGDVSTRRLPLDTVAHGGEPYRVRSARAPSPSARTPPGRRAEMAGLPMASRIVVFSHPSIGERPPGFPACGRRNGPFVIGAP
ncbi:putative DNA-directed DNA polymerase [Methylorubrum extorquens DM4]|uniref:DNA-directed DNA polymerase n=1 Tax=Methylorubrum extorquens (strain DSM 6343 / CIP 106787 / DM4) TaxID=661410 RepID=C7CFB9_METED|nr:putative DNA-directed DNA polymerase [Methylorubrum extorquens DM4]